MNDAPALKKVDIGVAMGSGTQVARHSSNMVLVHHHKAPLLVLDVDGDVAGRGCAVLGRQPGFAGERTDATSSGERTDATKVRR